jgi:N-acetylglucosaminyldiphosphoundecaprenol N-acetyl-beta-D-mannosaminyltransferase
VEKHISLLGVRIDAVSMAEAVLQLHAWLKGYDQKHVMTVNNEMLVEATKNVEFRGVLQSTALSVADSTGVVLAASFTGQKLPGRVPGVDLVQQLCASLDASTPVFFLGAAPGVAERAAEQLKKQNPQLKIVGIISGSPKPEKASGIVQTINQSGAHLLFVAFGAPNQDLWIRQYLHDMPGVRIAMGVGGTFDFLAGNVKRAPGWMRSVGLEWLWRLLLQPSRFGRIVRAVIVFPWLVLRYGKNDKALSP